MTFLFVLIALGVVFWFIAIQPQRRRQNAHMAMQDAVAEGLEIITAGGLHGMVVEAGEDVLRIEIAPDVTVRLDRRAVAAVVQPEDEDVPSDEDDLPPGEADENPNEQDREAG
jgi:preprotein translocase subunit YajC